MTSGDRHATRQMVHTVGLGAKNNMMTTHWQVHSPENIVCALEGSSKEGVLKFLHYKCQQIIAGWMHCVRKAPMC